MRVLVDDEVGEIRATASPAATSKGVAAAPPHHTVPHEEAIWAYEDGFVEGRKAGAIVGMFVGIVATLCTGVIGWTMSFALTNAYHYFIR